MDAFASAVDLLPSGGEPVGLVLLNRGNVHLQRGDAQAAIVDFIAAASTSPRPEEWRCGGPRSSTTWDMPAS